MCAETLKVHSIIRCQVMLSIVNIKCHRNFVQSRIIYRMVSHLLGSVEKRGQEAPFSPFIKLPFLAFLGGSFYL